MSFKYLYIDNVYTKTNKILIQSKKDTEVFLTEEIIAKKKI
jgi:hypothetical protein